MHIEGRKFEIFQNMMVLALLVTFGKCVFVQNVIADITIISRDSYAQVRAFSGAGGAVQQDEIEDNTETLTGMFAFDESVSNFVTENDPFSTGAAMASSMVNVMDDVIHSTPSALTLTTFRDSTASVQHISGPSNASANARHNFRVRFSVENQHVRYTLTGAFNPGPLDNGFNRMALYRPFTANTIFEFTDPQVVNETGVLQPGLTYEFRSRVFDGLGAGANSPGPTTESTSYDLQLHIQNVLIGDVNLDGLINLLDVEPFIDAIASGEYQIEADIDGDGEVNLLDVGPFIDLLSGG